MTEQRRLAAIVSADVAGYSRLMGRDESGTLTALKALRREVVDPRIAGHGGRIVRTTGDGLLLEFPSVVDAIRCVVEVQTEMATRIADVPENRRIAFRIGLHVGDITIDGDDIFGDGVNIAARLQEIATLGGVCVSTRVHDDVRDRLDISFDDSGAQTLKNIARPVHVWRWMPRSSSAQATSSVSPGDVSLALPHKPSIAVLPFQNRSGDPEQEYFADGVVEDIITALSRTIGGGARPSAQWLLDSSKSLYFRIAAENVSMWSLRKGRREEAEWRRRSKRQQWTSSRPARLARVG